MGDRINKKLGWGLTGLEHDRDGRITDPRINVQALEHRPDGTGPEYLKYLESLQGEQGAYDAWSELSKVIATVSSAKLGDRVIPWPVVHKQDGVRPDVLLIQPIGFPRWSRYDDPMDYAEECVLHDPPSPRVVALPDSIYPFSHTFMNAANGYPVDDSAFRMVRRLSKHQAYHGTDPKFRDAADQMAKVSKFKNAEDMLNNSVPAVPADISYVCSWTGVFTAPDVWLQLRPMLYVYWG